MFDIIDVVDFGCFFFEFVVVGCRIDVYLIVKLIVVVRYVLEGYIFGYMSEVKILLMVFWRRWIY